MTAAWQPEPGDEALTAQLFRYAQDMDTLMQQHDRLQKHHQMLLQSMGQEVLSDDLLPTLLASTAPLYWSTDAFGRILQTGQQNPPVWQQHPGLQVGQSVAQLLAEADRSRILGLLARFADGGSHASAIQLRLQVLPAAALQAAVELDVLLMPLQKFGSLEIDWYVQGAPAGVYAPLQVQAAFAQAVASDHGLLVTQPQGDIVAFNAACCTISGYSAEELRGNNLRMLNSGRHTEDFFQDLWMQLLDTGSWSGSLFYRRKAGQIFLCWKTIRMVRDAQGRVLSYLEAMVDLSYAEPSVRRLEAMANTDALTGLPNRRLLMERLPQLLAEAEGSQHALALLFIDLDRFKPINDEMGHAVGDLVLQEVALRMRNALLPGDLLARVGGDEFVVVLRGNSRVEMAEAIGARLQAALQPGMRIQSCQLTLGASIGCARYPQDGADMVTLMQQADAAMYGAKRFGMPFCFYDLGMSEGGGPNLEFDLWQALERQEISMVYQPQVHNNQGQALRGCEALMRWKHPLLGDVDPALFIALAERSGAIVPLGNWALREVCRQLRLWREQGMPELTLSLNLSLRQLHHPQFLGEVRRALQDNGLDARLLEMELSENQALMFVPSDAAHIQALRGLGVRIAIDDYGISFSSLSRLNFLSISSFKISAQCVRDLTTSADARAISSCMIAISRAMGIEVIAQGVETEEQASLLAEQGCHVIQGFYSGHALLPEALLALARSTGTLPGQERPWT